MSPKPCLGSSDRAEHNRASPEGEKQASAGSAAAPRLEFEERPWAGLAGGLALPHLLGLSKVMRGGAGWKERKLSAFQGSRHTPSKQEEGPSSSPDSEQK